MKINSFLLTQLDSIKKNQSMKNIISVLLLVLFAMSSSWAQKYAYVDTDYILENIPEYKDAQLQLDELSEEYKSKVEEAFAALDKLYKDFQAESVLMPEDIKTKRENELKEKRNQVRELQNQYFGPTGDLFDKREELIKPIQEKIFNAIEEIATEKNYAFVFDKAGSLSILYVNSKYDISDEILDKVGAELGTVRREDRVKKEYKGGSGKPTESSVPKNNPRSMSSPPGGMSPGGAVSKPGGTVNKGGRK